MEVLPDGFVPYTEWPEYLEDTLYPDWMQAQWVGDRPRGLRRRSIGFDIETYVSDGVPIIGTHNRPRLIIWQRLQQTGRQQGWYVNRFLDVLFDTRRPYVEAIVSLMGDDRDFEKWPRLARNQWLRWYAEGRFQIETVTLPDFWDAYQASVSWQRVPAMERDLILRKLTAMCNGNTVRLRVVREADTRAVLGGMATLDSREQGSSFYYVGFLCEEGKKSRAMVGLLHDWYQYAAQQKILQLQLGKVWTTPDRVGYSSFKKQFATGYITFPPALYRYVPRSH